ncbi:MAG: transposase [Rhodocyclaceae bacterium]|nr:transposase [Rhodocyclaceae bacterium]
MPNYRRNRIPGATYFFTVTLLNRRDKTLVQNIDLLRDAVRKVKTNRPFHIDAWVILPDHMHAIWTLPPEDADYSGRWRAIKTLFSKGLAQSEALPARPLRSGERGIWQRRFWEHTIRDDIDFARHVDYVHFNPVKHGHAMSVADWPYSTFHRDVASGIYPIDWAGNPDMDSPTGERDE